jgi:hypothetical protein
VPSSGGSAAQVAREVERVDAIDGLGTVGDGVVDDALEFDGGLCVIHPIIRLRLGSVMVLDGFADMMALLAGDEHGLDR